MEVKHYTKYIAKDGSSFDTEFDCLRYENSILEKLPDKLPELYLPELSNTVPITLKPTYGLSSHIFRYEWYRLRNEDDFHKLMDTIRESNENFLGLKDFNPPSEYPNIIILEKSYPNALMPKEQNEKYSRRYLYYTDEVNRIQTYMDEVNKSLKGEG